MTQMWNAIRHDFIESYICVISEEYLQYELILPPVGIFRTFSQQTELFNYTSEKLLVD